MIIDTDTQNLQQWKNNLNWNGPNTYSDIQFLSKLNDTNFNGLFFAVVGKSSKKVHCMLNFRNENMVSHTNTPTYGNTHMNQPEPDKLMSDFFYCLF